jgi:drug/metabolite transporter (DMT)-like permease
LNAQSAPRLGGVTSIAFAAVLFALLAVLARTLAGKLPAAEVIAVRFALSLVFMAGWFAVLRRKPLLTHPGALFLRGLFGGFAAAAYFFTIEQLGVGPATVLNFLAPCWAAVFASIFLKERAGPFAWVGLGVATVGGAIVTLAAGEVHRPEHFGLAATLGVLSGISGGAAMATLKKLRGDTDAGTIFTAFNLVGLGLVAPFAWKSWAPLEASLWPVLLAIALLSCAAQLLYSWAMAFTPVTRGSLATQLTPLFAAGFGALFLGELPNATGVVGGVLCIGGVVLGMGGASAPAADD